MICTIISTGEELLLECRNEHEMPCLTMKIRLHDMIWKLYCHGYRSFYVNCEYGLPLWAAEFICSLKLYNEIELHVVIPYEEQTTNWSEEQRDRYFSVHEKADSVYMTSTQCHSKCYETADKFMIDKSDLLVICGKSETVNHAVAYAGSIGVNAVYFPIA